MTRKLRNSRHFLFETLEDRRCLASVGWDGPGQGSADLKYYIGSIPSTLDRSLVEGAIEQALHVWSSVADVTFTKTNVPNQDRALDFSFTSIDGANGTLAQAYLPSDVNHSRIAGDVQFDSAEAWEVGNAQGSAAFDLVLVAVHEIGHALGVEHSQVPGAVMDASVSAQQSFTALAADDVDAVLALYAKADTASTNTTPTTSPTNTPTTPTTPTTPSIPAPKVPTSQPPTMPWTRSVPNSNGGFSFFQPENPGLSQNWFRNFGRTNTKTTFGTGTQVQISWTTPQVSYFGRGATFTTVNIARDAAFAGWSLSWR